MANPTTRQLQVDREIRLEYTDARIRAYVSAVVPIGDSPVDRWQEGRNVIERMAIHSWLR
jgi:hypothetical protein